MATPAQAITAARLAELQAAARRASGNMGRRAAAAVGDDIPRPRPVAETAPSPMGNVGFEPDLSAASDPAIAPEQWMPLARKEVAYRQGAGEPLTLEESRTLALALEQQGVDPFFLFADEVFPEDFKPAIDAALANDTRVLTPQQTADVLRRIERGEEVPPEIVAALRRSQAQPAQEVPAAAPVASTPEVAAAAPAPQSIVQVSGGKRPRFLVVGADGQEIGEATRVGNKNLYEFGGRRYAIDDTGTGVVEAGSAPAAPAPLDNLEQSGFDIAVGPNTTPNKKRTDKIDLLAERIRQATTETDTESLAGLRRMQAEVAALTDAERDVLLQHPAIAEGIESIAARRDPAARDAAIANAQRRLDSLAQKAGVSTTDRAAEQVATASDARRVAAQPRMPSPDRAAAQQDFAAAAQLLEESLPEGDWARLTDAFNKLDPERKAEVLRRLPSGSSLKAQAGVGMSARRADPTGPREMLTALLDNSTGEPSFLPNAVPQLTAGSGGLDNALLELDAAMRSGDAARIEEARLNVQTFPASPEEMQAAKRTFLQRQAAATALRNAIIGTDPMYVSEQSRMLAAQMAPAPRPAITPGARSIEVATEDVADAALPGMYETARAAERERQAQLAQRSPGGGTDFKDRLAAAEVEKARDLPLGLRSSEDPARQPPLERRSPSEWPIQTDDRTAIQQAQELQAAIQEVSEELRLAQVRRDEEAVAAAQGTLRRLIAQEDELFPPRLVQKSTGQVKAASPAILRGEEEVPKGWAVERGMPARSDRRINAGGSQETLDNAIISIVGGRPKMASAMPRARADMSPAERARIRDNVEITYGDDAIEYLPDEPEGDLPELGQDGKRSRTGSSRQESRVIGGLRTLYGDANPLSWVKGDGTPLYASADEAAEDLLSRNTVGWSQTHTLPDGSQQASAGYEVAKRSLADAIERHYGPTSARRRPDMAGEEAVTSRPSADIEPVSDAGVGDNLDASATDITEVDGSDPAPVAEKKPGRRRGKKAAAKPVGEELAETTGSQAGDEAATGAGSIDPVTASDELDPDTLRAIEEEADQVFETTRSNYLEVGEDRDAATQYATEARGRYVAEQRASRKGRRQPASEQAPVAGSDPVASPADNVADNLNASATEIDLDPVSGEGIPSSGKVYDYTNPPTDGQEVGVGTARVIDNTQDAAAAADTTTPQTPAAAGTNKGRGWWPYIGVGAAVTGLAGLSRLGGGVGAGHIDIPPPPGGGGGGAGGGRGGSGGGDFYPIPPGGNASAVDEAAAQEAAIERALERIRGSRPSSGGRSEPYQTFQNYGIWR